jgi:hypothetical protein
MLDVDVINIICFVGSDKERGLSYWKSVRSAGAESSYSVRLKQRLAASYDLPFGMAILQRLWIARYIPFLPTFGRQQDVASRI